MKKMVYFLTLIFFANCFANTEYFLIPSGSFTFVSENHGPYRLSSFNLKSYKIYTMGDINLILYGTIEKLNDWTRSYIFKAEDGEESTHRSSFLSFGSFLDCLKEFEIRDNRDIIIGYIKGNYFTKARAEFLFFNDKHELFAKANVNQSQPQLTIESPDEKILITGIKTLRNLTPYLEYIPPDYEYFWTIKKEDEDNVDFDPKFLWPFVGFIAEVWWYSSPYETVEEPLQ
jgi:hypothetical protein